MANNLNRDITPGEVVIVKEDVSAGSIEQRAFICNGGFGMKMATGGYAIIGKWKEDNQDDRIEGYQIDAGETACYQASHFPFAGGQTPDPQTSDQEPAGLAEIDRIREQAAPSQESWKITDIPEDLRDKAAYAVKCAYIGHSYSKGQSLYSMTFLDSAGKPGRLWSFSKPPKGWGVGGVYLCYFSADDKFWTGGKLDPVYQGLYEDADQRNKWRIKDRAADTAKAADSKRKADLAQNELREILEPIRKAMRETNEQGRAAIMALVMQELMKYGRGGR